MGFSAVAARLFAERWLAGPSTSDAIRVSLRANRLGMGVIINYLGEQLDKKGEVDATVTKYLELIKAVKGAKLKADITMKATQIGLVIDKKVFERNYKNIVKFALKNKVFVWLDMEEWQFVDDTIDVYIRSVKSGNVGICIQSYLRRSHTDLTRLAKYGAVVRLVKGAHRVEGDEFYSDSEVTANYSKLMNYLFRKFRRFTIATHDADMIEEALLLNKRYHRKVTYAMLMGIRNGYAASLAAGGLDVYIYVPFGEKWMAYAYRRLKEVSNMKLLLRSLLGG
jgi:proline dehydrogenase